MQPSPNTLATEIGLIAVSVAIVAGAVILRVLGYIDNTLLLEMIGIAAGIVVGKLALNAPSPAQQNQLNAQNVNLQQLVQYALSVLQPQAPVAPPQGQQTAQPVQASGAAGVTNVPAPANSSTVGNPVGTATLSTLTPVVVQPGASAVPGTPPMQTQFKTIQIPDVSLPTIPVVGQGIPLGQ